MANYPSTYQSLEEATRKLERYCSYQDRCHWEVEAKLKELGMIPEARATIIAHLIENDYLNEERFALNFVQGKFNQKNWGKVRLKSELRFRGIGPYLIKKALASIPHTDYLQKLEDLAGKKWEHITVPNPQLKKRKLYDYLAYRGWERDLIYDEIRKLSAKD